MLVELNYRNLLWLLETEVYGLINSNSKWKNHSYELFLKRGLQQEELEP